MPKIYLDNNASTLLDARVAYTLIEELQAGSGNPSSIHAFGQDVRNRVTKARRTIAQFLGVHAPEIIFTSGGSEALSMVLRGFFAGKPTGHIITSTVEHSAVYNTVKFLEQEGCEATFLSPGLWGAVTPEALKKAIRGNTRMIALMAVNNETGVKTDLEGVAAVAREKNIPLLIDGVALLGKELFTIPKGVSAMCFSAHKLHGPQGIGMAYVQNRFKMQPLIIGGGQEQGRRGGTENVLGIIGFAKAVELLNQELPTASLRMASLRDRLEAGICLKLMDVVVNGQGPRVVNTTNLSFPGVDGESLLMNMDLAGIAVSHGSACSSGSLEPSRILLNMGIPLDLASTSLRFSLSRFTTEQEIDSCIDTVVEIVTRLRRITQKNGGR